MCSGQVRFSFSSSYSNVGFHLFLFISLALLFRSLFSGVSVQYVSRNREGYPKILRGKTSLGVCEL